MLEKSMQFGEHQLSISTGKVAKQADASVIVNLNNTVVLVTAVINHHDNEPKDFLPLTVNYQEKAYAAGKIPGGYFKREGRPSESETLVARLIDRPARPLFDSNFSKEMQVMATVLSLNPAVSPDIPAMIGASAALSLSGAPFNGPFGAVKVAYNDGIMTINPSKEMLDKSALNLVVAGTKDSILMVESEANELPESTMISAINYGHEMMQGVINLIEELKQAVNKPMLEFEGLPEDETLNANLKKDFSEKFISIYNETSIGKLPRQAKIDAVKQEIKDKFLLEDKSNVSILDKYTKQLQADIVRAKVLNEGLRIDGRDLKTVRDITIETQFLPGVHGSCLFTRGETQALVVATLGSDKDKQQIDSIEGDKNDYFMLHYNFPPYSVHQISNQLSPKRREIGHGKLARRALEAIIPSYKDFTYVTRVVSDITESNGSSSMATVCGASLALMDAGVPIKKPVSGIAMGLVKEGDKYAILTDILGDEDALGDMDFKVAGTEDGVTALQMDIKIAGITPEIMEDALGQAKKGRMHILEQMNQHLPKPREISDNAPKIYTMNIPVNKIKDVIGKGGSMIKSLTEGTDSSIDIEDNGLLKLFCSTKQEADIILQKINDLIADVQVGKIYEGKVVKLVDFGAFVSVLSGKEGLLHISQITKARVEKVSDHLKEGQIVKVKVIDVEKSGKFKLSMKEAE